METDPWADATSSHSAPQSDDPDPGNSNPDGLSSSSRPQRLQPRRIVAQPTPLEAVDDDPLGGGPLAATRHNPVDKSPPPLPRKSSTLLPSRTSIGRSGLTLGQGNQKLAKSDGDNSEGDVRTTQDGTRDDRTRGEPGQHHASLNQVLSSPPLVQPRQLAFTPTRSQPSMSVEQAANPSFSITVGDPHKVGDLTTSHIVYSVRTKTTSKAYRQPEFEVKRRYKDFLWLYNTLHANNPGVVVPPPPEKQAVGRFENDFVESRRAALERMLNKTAHHPILQHDADLKVFLESAAFNVDVRHKERKEPNLTENKGVFSSFGINVGSSNKFVEQDDWFHDRRVYLDALENQLKALLRAMDGMVSQRKAMADAAGDFSVSLHALSAVELSPMLSGPLEALSVLQLTIRDVYDRQAQQDMLTFGITIEEYIRLIGSVKQAFGQRQKTFYSWHSAESELQKRKATQDKLLRQGRTQQDRLNQVSAEVSDAERKVHQARLLFEDMGRLLRQELDRFEREKVEDFKSGVETFLESAVEAQKELIEKWETFFMQLDADDDENASYRQSMVPQNVQQPSESAPAIATGAVVEEDSD